MEKPQLPQMEVEPKLETPLERRRKVKRMPPLVSKEQEEVTLVELRGD
jgi:hypothetical protein